MNDLLIATALLNSEPEQFSIEKYCFKEQIDFINDPAPFKTAVCSRRSGKTVACAADLVSTAIRNPRRVCLYITLSRSNAKRIIWGELLEINRRFCLGGKPNETDLSIKFPNDSYVYCSGASDRSEIEKFRGMAITLCYLDESQSFRAYISTLVDEIIAKALFDYHGTLCLIGTPGPVPAGYFYECSQSKEWSHHEWTMFQNPWLPRKSGHTAQETLERELKRTGLSVNSPTIQRECFGKWKVDSDALVFKYNSDKNHYDLRPNLGGPWNYVIGVDLGSNGTDRDKDAIAVLGWNDYDKDAYLVEEDIGGSQGISDLTEKLEKLITRFNPMKIVMDTGGLGKKIADEITSRYAIPISAAEKIRKFEFIELLNDAMRTARFFAKKDSQFASDCSLLEWERDVEQPGKLKISDRFHSDIGDSVLYAYREALHWLSEPEKVIPKVGTLEWHKQQEEQMEESIHEHLRRKQNPEMEDLWADLDQELM